MLVKSLKIRGTHIHSFRSGVFGKLIGVYSVTPIDCEQRMCYAVLYEDGVIDYIPVCDVEQYEIKAGE